MLAVFNIALHKTLHCNMKIILSYKKTLICIYQLNLRKRVNTNKEPKKEYAGLNLLNWNISPDQFFFFFFFFFLENSNAREISLNINYRWGVKLSPRPLLRLAILYSWHSNLTIFNTAFPITINLVVAKILCNSYDDLRS